MRLLFLALLASLGFAGSAAASQPPRPLLAAARERVRQEDVPVDLAEGASLPGVPARVAAHIAQSTTPSRFADGGAGLLGESRAAPLGVGRVAREVAAEPTRPTASPRRRQPEGRGPPRSPRAA